MLFKLDVVEVCALWVLLVSNGINLIVTCINTNTHVCGNGTNNSPGRPQYIIWTNADFLLIGLVETTLSEPKLKRSCKKDNLRISYEKCHFTHTQGVNPGNTDHSESRVDRWCFDRCNARKCDRTGKYGVVSENGSKYIIISTNIKICVYYIGCAFVPCSRNCCLVLRYHNSL